MKKLPDKPSDLLKLAMYDLAKIEDDPRYAVSMDIWHWPESKYLCTVCLAGAVMAKSLDGNPEESIYPYSLGDKIGSQLRAVDYFRKGMVAEAMYNLGVQHTLPEQVSITPWHYDKAQFRSDMQGLINLLEEAGL